MRIVDNILDLIKKKQTTKYRVTKDCNLPSNIFTFWENGRQKPSLDALIKIADYFNVSVDCLIGREQLDISNNAASNPIFNRIIQLNELQQIQVMAYIDGLQGVKSHTTQIDTEKLVAEALNRGIENKKMKSNQKTKIG